MQQQFGTNDAVLVISLLYSCVDMSYEWESFSTCQQPIHKLLLASYACVIMFRVMHLVGSWLTCHAAGSSERATAEAAVDFLLNLRQKGSLARLLAVLSWALALPVFSLLTIVGTFWLYEVMQTSPECVPSSSHMWFTGLWLLLSYMWILVHLVLLGVAWMLEKRVRKAENDLRSVEDDDSRSRWGEVSRLSNYSALQHTENGNALTPTEIQQLSGVSSYCESSSDCTECPICLAEFQKGDNIRQLPNCGHCFHRACIDIWLLRCSACPLCKQSALPDQASV